MDNETKLKYLLSEAGKSLGISLSPEEVVIDHARDKAHGDYATNFALKYAKPLGQNPRELAQKLAGILSDPIIEKIEIAGPGFINFFLKKSSMTSLVGKIIEEGDKYGQGADKGYSINVEFVSANPTGDLHLGHTRCATVGDDVCRLYEKAGYQVTREFYLNDCGNQIEHLGHSLRCRYHELFGEPSELYEDDYHGADIIEIAKAVKEEYGDKYLKDDEESHDFFIEYGKKAELDKIWRDMDEFGVRFTKVTKESEIRSSGVIEKTIAELKDYTYVKDGATYLRTSQFLDDKDRPIIKSNGLYTYFAPDIAYHCDKLSRGYDLLVDVLGSDHHGYIARMKSALMMKGYPEDKLEPEFVQVVRVFKDGEEVRMSKRTGKAITHRELVEEVGKDAVRYFFADRAASSHLDFNYNLATEQSSSNPVYYAQYAHARCCSILQMAGSLKPNPAAEGLSNDYEMSILKHLADFPSMIETAAKTRSPNRVTAYIHSLAELFHEFYSHNRVLDETNPGLSESRLALVDAVRIVLSSALDLIGVSAPSKM
ncbi:MAG: arginine--tRNA ligase [Bacillota bacterium]|nr:arginine--tRNA ligase [Bacillota bacterium]